MNEAKDQPIYIFEMGFGTDLNAFLTAIETEKCKCKVYYTATEKTPLSLEEAGALNYTEVLQHHELFNQLHQTAWSEAKIIHHYFTLHKVQNDLIDYSTDQQFYIIYYDAFAPNAQPELWTIAIFEKLRSMLSDNGMLVTYCAKGNIRWAMIVAGFTVKKLPGPPGKREMLRVIKS